MSEVWIRSEEKVNDRPTFPGERTATNGGMPLEANVSHRLSLYFAVWSKVRASNRDEQCYSWCQHGWDTGDAATGVKHTAGSEMYV